MAPSVWAISRVVVSNIERDDFGGEIRHTSKNLAAAVGYIESVAKKQKSAVHLSSGCLLIGVLLWQYSARLLDSGLEAQGRAGTKVVSLRISPQPLSLVRMPRSRHRGRLGSPFFSAASVGAARRGKLLDDVLTVESAHSKLDLQPFLSEWSVEY